MGDKDELKESIIKLQFLSLKKKKRNKRLKLEIFKCRGLI